MTHHFQPPLETFLKHLFFSLLALISSATAYAQDCSINPGACQPKPIPSECPAGKHWVTTGTGIAHCVTNDPVCTGGTVVHDAIGEPQYCQTSEDRTASCPAGYSGYKDQTRTVKTALNGTKSYGSWTTTYNGCEKDPEPEPTPAPSTPSSGSGSTADSSTPSTGSGSAGSPSSPSGGSGSAGDPSNPSTGNDSSTHGGGPVPEMHTCSNGATNYPTCTIDKPVTYTCKSYKEYTYLTECSSIHPSAGRKYIWQIVTFCTGSDGSTKTERDPFIQDGVASCGTGGSHIDR